MICIPFRAEIKQTRSVHVDAGNMLDCLDGECHRNFRHLIDKIKLR